jgi:hypothetical protein
MPSDDANIIAVYAVPIANDVWLAVHEIARRLQCSPEVVVEQLAV